MIHCLSNFAGYVITKTIKARALLVSTYCRQPKLVATGKMLQVLKGHEKWFMILFFCGMGLCEQEEDVICAEQNYLGNNFF